MIMERDRDDLGMVAPLFDVEKISSIVSRRSSTSSSQSSEQCSSGCNTNASKRRPGPRDASNSEQCLTNYSTERVSTAIDSHSTSSRESNNNSLCSVSIGIGESSASQEYRAFKHQTVSSNHQIEEERYHQEASIAFGSKNDQQCKDQSTTKLHGMKSLPVFPADSTDTDVSIREMRRSFSVAGSGTQKNQSDFRRCKSNIHSTRKKFIRRTTHLGGMELLKPRSNLENERTDDFIQIQDIPIHTELSDTNLNLIEDQWPLRNNFALETENQANTISDSNYQSQLNFLSQFSDGSITSEFQAMAYSTEATESCFVTSKRTAVDQHSTSQMVAVTPSKARLVVLPLEDDSLSPHDTSYSNSQSFDINSFQRTETTAFIDHHKESISSSESIPPPLPDCSPPVTQDNQRVPFSTNLTDTSEPNDESEVQEEMTHHTGSRNAGLYVLPSLDPFTSSSSLEHSYQPYPVKSLSAVSSAESREETPSLGSVENKCSLESTRVTSSTDSSSTSSSEESSCEDPSTDYSCTKSTSDKPESLNIKTSEIADFQQTSHNSMFSHDEHSSTTCSGESPNPIPREASATGEVTNLFHSPSSPSIKNVISKLEITQSQSSEPTSTIVTSPVNANIMKSLTALTPYSESDVPSSESVMKSKSKENIPANFPINTTVSQRAVQINPSLKNRRDLTQHLHLSLHCANNRKNTSEQTTDVPPPIPPKSASFSKKDTSVRFPFHVTTERRGSSWNMDDRTSPQDSPPNLPPKRPCSYQNRRCCSTLIDPNTVSRIALLRSNSTETTVNAQVQPPSSPSVSSKECDSLLVETDIPPSLAQKNVTVPPPPRPPSMYRSISHNEESMKNTAFFILTSEKEAKSEPSTIGKNYGESIKASDFIEARNIHVKSSKLTELLESTFAKLEIDTEARLQHFPVKIDSTHQKISVVSQRFANLLSPSSDFDANTFLFPDFGVVNRMTEFDDQQERRNSFDQSDNHDIDMCMSLDNKEAINESMFVKDSQTDSDEYSPRLSKNSTTTRLSARFSREIPMYQRGGTIRPKKHSSESADVQLLQDEQEVGVESRFDLSQLGVAEESSQPTSRSSKSRISLSQIPKVSLQAVSDNLKLHFGKMSSNSSAKKEENEDVDQLQRSHSDRLLRKQTAKANAPRNKSMSLGVPAFLRFTMTRDPSTVRGIPSDLNPLMDSAIQAIEEERHNIPWDSSSHSLLSSSDKGRKPGVWDRRNSSSASDSLRFSNLQEPRSSKSSGENTDPSSSDTFSIVSFVSDQIDGRSEENTLPPLICRQDSRINSGDDNSEWNVEGINHSIKGLIRDMERYTEVLGDLHETYSIMRSKTPDGIRQRFDLAFKEIQLMIQLQKEVNAVVAVSENDFGSIAEVFKKREFSVYKRYTVLANNIQKDMKSYATYFRENFTDLATKIMVPSTRLNVYAQHLRGLLNHFCSDSRHLLQEAITFLETLKDQANTEMTINVIQNCPVELRLLGLIRHVGEMYYEGDNLSRKLHYLILFDSILIITENKYDFFTYKQHIRSEQLMEVHEHGVARLILKVCPSYVNDVVTYKFRTVTNKDRNTWVSILKNWQDTNRPSHKNTVINQELISQLNTKPERFWPLSLWLISPRLEEAVKVVKYQEIPKAPPRRSNVDIFHEFVKLEEDFVDKLNVLLDPESMPPPAILGSVLRKIRRFHKAQFLPKLKKAHANEPSSILDCIIGNLPNIPCLYKEFIEVRAGLTLTMIDGDHVRLYICPFQHLAAYIEWLYEVSCMPRYHSHLRGQLNILLNCVEDARVSLLHIAIPNCRMDYYKAGDILHRGSLESRVKSKNVKSNQNYYVILFEKVLMFTRPRMPSYEFVQAVWLDQLTLGPPTECKRTFKVEERLHKKELVYELRAESAMQRNVWVDHIVGILHKRALDIKRKVSAGRV